MNKTYLLKDAIVYNPSGKKCNAIAMPATLADIKQHKSYFGFDFETQYKQVITYKIYKEGDNETIQGLVSFNPSLGILQCSNMEINSINEKPLLLHSGLGKCMVALCCMVSFDLGFDGFITFEAKNKLITYYKRYGAYIISGLRMVIETPEAQKLVLRYS